VWPGPVTEAFCDSGCNLAAQDVTELKIVFSAAAFGWGQIAPPLAWFLLLQVHSKSAVSRLD
jgi:hypothetical protein